MQRYDKFPNRPNFSATFLHKNTKKTEGMTSVKGKGDGSFYNICAGAHVREGEGLAEKRRARRRRGGGTETGGRARRQRHAGTEARGRARKRRDGGKGTGTEAGGKNTGERGKRPWVTGKKVLGCLIRAPARNDNGGRPYHCGRTGLQVWAAAESRVLRQGEEARRRGATPERGDGYA